MKSFFLRYNDINLDYIYTDKHMHTNWTDGKDSVMQVINRAYAVGLKEIAITEHCRRSSTYYPEFYIEADNYRKKKTNLNVLIGYEAKIYNFNGQIDVSDSINKRSEISIASVHSFPIGGKFYNPKFFEKKLCQEIELRLSLAGIENSNFDILGHPGAQSLKYYGDFPVDYFEEIIKCCNSNDVAFDFNYQYHNRYFDVIEPLLIKHNPYVSLGSDAHKLSNIGIWTKVKKLRSKFD